MLLPGADGERGDARTAQGSPRIADLRAPGYQPTRALCDVRYWVRCPVLRLRISLRAPYAMTGTESVSANAHPMRCPVLRSRISLQTWYASTEIAYESGGTMIVVVWY
eukprot:3222486-Rhodomonas_salina.1